MIDLCNNCSVDSVLQTSNSYTTFTPFSRRCQKIDILRIYFGIHAMLLDALQVYFVLSLTTDCSLVHVYTYIVMDVS